MIKVLEEAIDKIRSLPEARQQYAAQVLEEIAATGDGAYRLTDEESRLVREGLDDLDAGRIVPETEMSAFWNRHRS